MMRRLVLLALVCPLAIAQAPQPPAAAPAAKSTAPAAAKAAEVPPSAPVITIQVPCGATPAPKQAAPCTQTVTRAQFDRLAEAISPNLPSAMRRQLAQQYAQMMALANRAEAQGLEKDANVQELFKLARMNVLAKFLVQQIEKKSENVPEAAIDSYYKDNPNKFEQVKLERIYVPKPLGKDVTPAQQTAVEQLAQKIRDRAAAGEDMTKLEGEAFQQVKASSDIPEAEKKNYTPPKVDLGEIRRGRLPEAHEAKVFSLNPGQVSPVIPEGSGYFIYKLISKQQVPLAAATGEIKEGIARQQFQQELQKIESAAKPVFNEAYFGAGEQAKPAGEAKQAAPPEKEPAPDTEQAPKK